MAGQRLGQRDNPTTQSQLIPKIEFLRKRADMQKKQGRGASGHLSRLKPAELDPLAEYGLPSKGEKRCASNGATKPSSNLRDILANIVLCTQTPLP